MPSFGDSVKAFLRRYMLEPKLTEMAFMGLDEPEPWIFFGMVRIGGTFVRTKPPAIGGADAQMLIFRGGPPVIPSPKPMNFQGELGVSTASPLRSVEFDGTFRGDLEEKALADPASPLLRDVPDIIANPERSHVLNTDCVSCHTESSLRSALKIINDARFKYKVPAGLSGVDERTCLRLSGMFAISAGFQISSGEGRRHRR